MKNRILFLYSTLCFLIPLAAQPGYLSTPPTSATHQLHTGYTVGTTPGSGDVTILGGASYTIPLFASPGTAGVQPQLSLSYSSQGVNGVLGMGWDLAGLSAISRVPQTFYLDGKTKPVQLNAEDPLALDGNRLIRTGGAAYGSSGAQYGTENETFSLITTHDAGNGHVWFKVWNTAGWELEYGSTPDARILPEGSPVPYMWRLNKLTDPNGNYILFEYTSHKGESRLSRIAYTGNTEAGILPYNTIECTYLKRKDTKVSYIAGASVTHEALLEAIQVKSEGNLVRRYDFHYALDTYTHLSTVTESAGDGTQMNPIVIDRGPSRPQQFRQEVRTDINLEVATTYAGDFNGDGKSDLLSLNKQDKKVHFYLSGSSGSAFTDYPINGTYDGALIGDLDNDGLDDVLLFQETEKHIYHSYTYDFYPQFSRIEGGSFSSTAVGQAVFSIPEGNVLKGECLIGDFDGDGNNEVLMIHKTEEYTAEESGSKHTWSAFSYMRQADGSVKRLEKGNGFFYHVHEYMMADYDGDGRVELLCIMEDRTHALYQLDNSTLKKIHSGDTLRADLYLPGDFDGDGKTDVLTCTHYSYTRPNEIPPFTYYSAIWHVYYSNGKEYLPGKEIPLKPKAPHEPVYLIDVDGDGKTDIVFPMEQGTYILKDNFTERFDRSELRYTVLEGTPVPSFCYGDFNGDGVNDILFRRLEDKTNRLFYFPSNEQRHLVHAVTNGLNQSTRFEYTPLTEPSVYTKGLGAYYPLVDYQGPMYVVSALQFPNDSGGVNRISFTYAGAKIHKQGNGFLGFTGMTQTYSANNRMVKDSFEIDPTFFSLSLKKSEVYDLNLGQRLSYDSCVTQITGLGNKRYLINPAEKIAIDEVILTKTHTLFTYEPNSSLPLETLIRYFSGPDEPAPFYMEAQYYMDYQNRFRNLRTPGYTKTSIWKEGTWDHKAPLYFTYDSRGNISGHTQYKDDPLMEVNTSTEYTTTGLPLKVTVRNRQSGERVDMFEYDPRHRWKIQRTAPANFISRYTFDPAYGNLISETSPGGQTTRYTYDAWGRLIQIHYPDGNWAAQSLSWYTSTLPFLETALYKQVNTYSNAHENNTVYNASGRELMHSQKLDFNKTLYVFTAYDALGRVRVHTEAQPVIDLSNQSYRYTAYGYEPWYGNTAWERDYANGPDGTQTNSLLINNTYEYDFRARKISLHDHIKGISKVNEYDAAGNLVRSTHPAADIRYTYTLDGKVKRIESLGGITEYTYDKAGNLASAKIPNAGKTTYRYNGFNELLSRTDANQITTTFVYTPDGKILTKTLRKGNGSPEIYRYQYFETGANKGLLKKVSNNFISTSFYYDSYGKISSVEKYIDGKTFTTAYQYDALQRLGSYTFPNPKRSNRPYTINYGYEGERGGLLRIGNAQNNQLIWKLNEVNNLGLITETACGNGLKTHRTYEPETHRLIRLRSGGDDYSLVSDWAYTYEKGMINSRTDLFMGQEESFTYDKALRLGRVDQSIWGGYYQNKSIFGYNQKGNMNYKSDVGALDYTLPDKPHALSKVALFDTGNPLQKSFSSAECRTTYTLFHKIKTLSNEKGDVLEFTYGPDQQRIKTVLSRPGKETKTTYYMGDYELEETDSYQRQLYYIYGDQWVGILVKDSRYPDQDRMYYVYTDHLGSFDRITDEEGTLVQTQSFDVWGNRRMADFWMMEDCSTDLLFNRGFTGHEHLPEFNLINMNGRLYDPVVGQFLSVDPMAEEFPGMSPYSYCGFDPVNYTDPTGLYMYEWKLNPLTRMLDYSGSGGGDQMQYVTTDGSTAMRKFRVNTAEFFDIEMLNYLLFLFDNGLFGMNSTAIASVLYQQEGGSSYSELNIGGFVDGPSIGSIILDGVQGALEVGGLIPGLGEAADLTNALIYTFRKDNKNAALSLGSAVPFVGWGAVSAKWGSKISSWVSSKVAAKLGMKQLQRFNSIEGIIENAGKLDRLKGGIHQGFIQGNADDIFKGLSQQYGVKIQKNGTELFFQSGNIRVGLHGSIRGAGIPTMHINNAGQLYKIRITP